MSKIDQLNRRKVTQAINLVEELSWLLDSKNIDLKETSLLLRSLLETSSSNTIINKFVTPNPNKNYLIGVLPNLFQDIELFKTNIDLADFAETVLKIDINRAEKRSRYELIGLIVCEVTQLDETDLSTLVNALSKISGSTERLREIKAANNKANFSWNDAIKTLSAM